MTQLKRHPLILLIRVLLVALGIGLVAFSIKGFLDLQAPVGKEQAIEIAKKEALSLGYDVPKMKIECNRKKDQYEVYFWEPGVLGGDLTVSVDTKTGQILNTLQGQ